MGNTFKSTSDDGTSQDLIRFLMSNGDKQLPNKDTMKGLWLSYDMNGDNKLGRKEILSFLKDFFGVFCRIMEEERKKNKSPSPMQKKIYDEATSIKKHLDKEADQAYDEMDADGNNVISFEEFAQWITLFFKKRFQLEQSTSTIEQY